MEIDTIIAKLIFMIVAITVIPMKALTEITIITTNTHTVVMDVTQDVTQAHLIQTLIMVDTEMITTIMFITMITTVVMTITIMTVTMMTVIMMITTMINTTIAMVEATQYLEI